MLSRRKTLIIVLLTIGSATHGNAQASASVQLPRGNPVTIDGRIDDAEWNNALRIEHPVGTVVRLIRDDAHLFVAITSDRPGFVSLCLARNDTIHVLHASAALGAVTYRPSGGTWSSPDSAFRYSMRNRALDENARRERAAYLSDNGWVATTVSMTEGRSQEMQIALARFSPPFALALGRFLLGGAGGEAWPSTLSTTDGCVEPQLVRGDVPRELRFNPVNWLRVER